jgi:hypothetical protein
VKANLTSLGRRLAQIKIMKEASWSQLASSLCRLVWFSPLAMRVLAPGPCFSWMDSRAKHSRVNCD